MRFLREQQECNCERKIMHVILAWRQWKEGSNTSILIYAPQNQEGMLTSKRMGWTESKGGLEGDHTTVTTEHFFLTGLAKTVTYTWNRACPREQGISPPQPSNSFALIPHFTTTQTATDSCWKSPVFLFGLTVPSARPAHKKELATLICKKFDLFRKISTDTYRTTTNFPKQWLLSTDQKGNI